MKIFYDKLVFFSMIQLTGMYMYVLLFSSYHVVHISPNTSDGSHQIHNMKGIWNTLEWKTSFLIRLIELISQSTLSLCTGSGSSGFTGHQLTFGPNYLTETVSLEWTVTLSDVLIYLC